MTPVRRNSQTEEDDVGERTVREQDLDSVRMALLSAGITASSVEALLRLQLPQRQDALIEQLRDLAPVAERYGMYDAADWLRRVALI